MGKGNWREASAVSFISYRIGCLINVFPYVICANEHDNHHKSDEQLINGAIIHFLLRARPTMPPPIPHIAPITEARKLTMKKMIKTVVSLIDCMDSRL